MPPVPRPDLAATGPHLRDAPPPPSPRRRRRQCSTTRARSWSARRGRRVDPSWLRSGDWAWSRSGGQPSGASGKSSAGLNFSRLDPTRPRRSLDRRRRWCLHSRRSACPPSWARSSASATIASRSGGSGTLMKGASVPYCAWSGHRTMPCCGPSTATRGEASPRAFTERGPRVFVEVGHAHPLADRLRLPAGRLVLIRATGEWTVLDEAAVARRLRDPGVPPAHPADPAPRGGAADEGRGAAPPDAASIARGARALGDP